MVAVLVLSVIGFILAFTFFIIGVSDDDNESAFSTSVVVSTIIFLVIIIIVCLEDKEPKALDVYQGRTTLEITYRNSIPVDSVVVFK